MFTRLRTFASSLASLERRIDKTQAALGRIELRQLLAEASEDLHAHEASVYSQWGEDGILQFLSRRVTLRELTFVEFGVENYRESNTRYLLTQCGWSGLVLDGSPENIEFIHNDEVGWQHPLDAVCAFITRENIDSLLRKHGRTGDLGLLSVDIDGNDYWVWEAIEAVTPRIVVVEYNALFGPRSTVTVPYAPDFQRSAAHYSCLYYGASLAALTHLGERKGYALVGTNSAGNNAFFVRADLLGSLRRRTAADAWRPARFRESRDAAGRLGRLGPAAARNLLADLPLVDPTSGRTLKISELVV